LIIPELASADSTLDTRLVPMGALSLRPLVQVDELPFDQAANKARLKKYDDKRAAINY